MTAVKIQNQELLISHINQYIFTNKIDIYIQSIKYWVSNHLYDSNATYKSGPWTIHYFYTYKSDIHKAVAWLGNHFLD